MAIDADIKKLLYLCFRLIQSQANKPIVAGSEWINDAQLLGTKLFRHVASMEQLSSGTQFDYGPNAHFKYIDHSSIAVLIRAAIEAYLTFNYLFTNDSDKIAIYRHRTWALGGLLDRTKMFANTEESKKVQAQDIKNASELANLITSDPLHHQQNRDRRKDILSGKWKPKGGWNSLGAEAEFHSTYFDDIYNHLSGHAHASYISSLQIRDAATFDQQKSLAAAVRINGCLVLAHFAFAYVKAFPQAQVVLEEDADAHDLADTWFIRKKDVDHLYSRTN